MQPYEELISKLGELLNTPLQADSRQACLIEFPGEGISAQIDLDTSGERILVGTMLGDIPPGNYREQILLQALHVNALPRAPRGTLAYSEKNDALILFQYFPLATTTPEKLCDFLKLFIEHARIWEEALKRGEVPAISKESNVS